MFPFGVYGCRNEYFHRKFRLEACITSSVPMGNVRRAEHTKPLQSEYLLNVNVKQYKNNSNINIHFFLHSEPQVSVNSYNS